MSSPLESLVATGTKLWLDSIDPDLVRSNRKLGASGATSNPVIVEGLIKTGRFDDRIAELIQGGLDDSAIAWQITDELVRGAQEVFFPVWQETAGNNGYVSFELDPLLEDPQRNIPHAERVKQYIELGKHWSAGHKNRMIKVPATPAGLDALEELCAAGVTLNVTLIFSPRQYRIARDRMWAGARRRKDLSTFKSVYSIFVSRVDVYTEQHVPQLTKEAQGEVGIVNAKRIWAENRDFWKPLGTPLAQEMIFASTGVKNKQDNPAKYVAAFAGSDIETNPPATNEAVQKSGLQFTRQVDKLPPASVLADIDAKVSIEHMEETLMREGIEKFANPQKALLAQIAASRQKLTQPSGKA